MRTPLGVLRVSTRGEAAWRNAVLEQPLSFAEHRRKDPDAIFVDEFDGDQRLQQFTAAPDMQRRPIRCLPPARLHEAAFLRAAGDTHGSRAGELGKLSHE